MIGHREKESDKSQYQSDRCRCYNQSAGVIVCRTVSALITTAHLTNVHHVEFVRLYDRFVEPFGRVIVVDPNGQVARHVGDRIPAFEGELDASIVAIQRVEIENDFVIEKLGPAQIAHPPGQDVLIQHLLLHVIASRHGNVQHGHTGLVGFTLVGPAGTDVVRNVRIVAAGEAQTRQDRKGSDGGWRDETIDVDVVLQRQLGDGVTGSARLNLNRTPCVGYFHKLRRRQIVLRDVEGLL